MSPGFRFRALGVALLLLLAALTAGRSAEGLLCAVCGKPITGRYIEDGGAAYHPDCYERHRAPRCAVCGKAILGARIRFEGKDYHERCYRGVKQPRCAACGRPIEGTYLISGGKSYHPACLRAAALRCAVCGLPLEDAYLEDAWGNAFHARHGREVLCPFCGRVMAPSTTGGSLVSLACGLRICALCAREAVVGREEAAEILETVRLRLEGIFPVPRGSFSWELADQAGLLRRAPGGGLRGEELGVTRGERGRSGAKAVTRSVRVTLLSGLPRWLFPGVAAHELVHVWQQLHDLDRLPPDQAEGSAEYASYLLLKEGGTAEGRVRIDAMEKSPDPVYGDGFRKARRAAGPGASPARLREILERGRGWPQAP